MKNFNVAYCGLYCAECRSFKKGSCLGCYDNEKASWCEIKKCCISNGYSTCADCTITNNKLKIALDGRTWHLQWTQLKV